MQIMIQSKTLAVTAALRAFIERQLNKLARLQPRATTVTVFLETVARKKNDLQASVARVKISMPGKDLIIERRAQDLYTAVVDVAEHAFRYLRKTKEKRLTNKRSRAYARLPIAPADLDLAGY
jgi:ribosomal subunit interface protein